MDDHLDEKQEQKFRQMTETPVSRLICRLAAINIPSRVRLPLQSPRPDSADPELVKAWKKEYDASNDNYKSVVTKITPLYNFSIKKMSYRTF